jgi:hypothetical protein
MPGKRLFEKRLELIKAMHRAGVKMLAATDALVWYVFPGFSLHASLEKILKDAELAANRN